MNKSWITLAAVVLFYVLRPSTGLCQSVTAQYINGIPQAAQFPGAPDACLQLRNAASYALTHNSPLVDATGFIGTVACSTDPFGGLVTPANTGIRLTVRFGVTHFQSSVQWTITNSGVSLLGAGPFATQVEYTGATGNAAILYVNGGTGSGVLGAAGITGIHIEGMYFYGDTIGGVPNVTDGVLLTFVNRSRFDSVYAWGVSGCGIHTEGAVTDTFIQPRVSSADAFISGIEGTHPYPYRGICLEGDAGAPGGPEDTTSGSIIDPAVEGVTDIGIYLGSADQMHIQGGTSEQNKYGIYVNLSSAGVNPGVSNKFNSFNTIDLEGNTLGSSGGDITDLGQANTYVNILSASTCSGCQSVYFSGGGSQYALNGYPATGISGGGYNGLSVPGYSTTSGTAGTASPLPSLPKGYMVIQLQGANVKVPYYGN